jgi:hypothetical protein
MADDQESRGPGPEDLGQDPYVERLRPDPSQPPERLRILEGLLGDSDREGYKRLYFIRELDHYAEFRAEDVLFSEPIPPDEPPFLGQQATRVGLRREATIEYTRLRTPRPVDEFDLDVRLGAPRGLRAEEERFGCTRPRTGCPCTEGTGCVQGETFANWTCDGSTCEWTCDGSTCPPDTFGGERTCDGSPTCRPTCAGEWTCHGSTCGPGYPTRRWTCDGSTCGVACTAGCP